MSQTSQANAATPERPGSEQGLSGSQVFVGRQPIFDGDLSVFAYELLFRDGDGNRARVVDGEQATLQTLVNTLMEFGLDEVVGNHLAFLNLNRSLLLRHADLPAMQQRFVLEVLEDIEPDAEVIAALQALAQKGFRIALDDFVYRDTLKPLVELADIIKIDIQKLEPEQVRLHVAKMRPYDVKFLAEKVETHEQFEFCKSLGFQYFQGYFLSRPKVLSGKRLPANRLAVLQLLEQIQNPDVSVAELEQLISRDVSLSYRILRYINSAQFAGSRKIESINRAVVMIGLRQLRALTSLFVLSQLDDKPVELMRIALVRARMCELLSQHLGTGTSETHFTIGLFSTLDALLDRPIEEIVAALPLNADVVAALTRREGIGGAILGCVLACERGEWTVASDPRFDFAVVSQAYHDALKWTDATTRLLGAKVGADSKSPRPAPARRSRH